MTEHNEARDVAPEGRPDQPERKNPPLLEDIASADGGVSASGGVAGGARGHGGQSDAGAGSPMGDTAGGPAEHRASSRMDLDHPSSDVGDDDRGGR